MFYIKNRLKIDYFLFIIFYTFLKNINQKKKKRNSKFLLNSNQNIKF